MKYNLINKLLNLKIILILFQIYNVDVTNFFLAISDRVQIFKPNKLYTHRLKIEPTFKFICLLFILF